MYRKEKDLITYSNLHSGDDVITGWLQVTYLLVRCTEARCSPPVSRVTFLNPSEEEVRGIIMSSANASCLLDPIPPTWLLKQCCDIDILLPVITQMTRLSLRDGIVPDCRKNAPFIHM
ncbi:uncharacterized protein [Montipora capricornis]|uniref:uncharacterized protein n=1 Tax=Montipora capricornis TaxID=246305 RepID=UPI0035F1D396